MPSLQVQARRLRVAMVIKTPGLEFDDRVRRECTALSPFADLHIFANLDSNTATEGVTSYGVPFTALRLKSRDYLPAGRHLAPKALELWIACQRRVSNYDVVWCHEEYSFACALLLRGPRIVWDLHELPEVFEAGPQRRLLRLIERRAAAIVHANPERRDYVLEKRLFEKPAIHAVVRNHPDRVFLECSDSAPVVDEARRWLGDDPYVYLQGIGSDARNGYESLSAALMGTNLKVVVVGQVDDAITRRAKAVFGGQYLSRVFQLGMTPQLAAASLLRGAMFSIVCYRHLTNNDVLCEPNRFFQALAFGVPVVVGNNLTMANVVRRYNCGVVVAGDGRDGPELLAGVRELCSGYSTFRANAIANCSEFVWDGNSVVDVLRRIGAVS